MRAVSVPSSGDYQFLRVAASTAKQVADEFPSPHPGIINFFEVNMASIDWSMVFPSPHPGIINFFIGTRLTKASTHRFPSPHPGIINFFLHSTN